MRSCSSFIVFIVFGTSLLWSSYAKGQCCAGGSGCTIAGSASQGVFQNGQLELSSNFQFIHTNSFYKENKSASYAERTFDGFKSTYQYFKVGYGISDRFTLSLETGYYLDKEETGLDGNPLTTYSSRGFGDLLIFPKYSLFNSQALNHHDEITVGVGFKLPLGSYNDSTGNIEPFSGQIFYVTNPTAVQLSSGAQDLVFHALFSRRLNNQQLTLSASTFYIVKGYNPNGEKQGNYTSLAFFINKTFFNSLGIGLQARYEKVQRMQINESVLLFGRPSNYYPEATGYKKVFLAPQVSYIIGSFSFYASYDIPIYQYLNTSPYYTQAASDFQANVGVAYRFTPVKVESVDGSSGYYCPMHPEIVTADQSKCPICGMDLIRKKL